MTSATDRSSAPVVAVAPARGETRAVALVLPGGRADSFDPTTSRQLTGVRMRPFAAALHRAGAARGLAVWLVRYRVRGWNGEQMSPVADVRWVLDDVRRRHGDAAIGLVGHSMGGRTAIRVGGDDGIASVAALAPWLPKDEPVDQLSGRRLLIVHGTFDKVTSPRASARFADRARAAGADVDFVSMRGETHAMLLRARRWHALTTQFTLDALPLCR